MGAFFVMPGATIFYCKTSQIHQIHRFTVYITIHLLCDPVTGFGS